jgi:hypothetical protein
MCPTRVIMSHKYQERVRNKKENIGVMAHNPRADWISTPSPLPQVTLHLEQLKQARETAQQLMIKAQQSWVKHRDMPKYKEGDQVWLEGKNLCLNQLTAKLAPRRHGPFKIIKVLLLVSYQLALLMQWSIHPVFHINLLTPYRETITHGPNYQRPVPDLVDGEEEYSVEKILDSRKFGRKRCLQYLVKWEGYPDSDDMWVDKDDVFADDKVWEFKASNPAKETHIRSLSFAKSPYPSALTHPHLLQQHTLRYMSSNGGSDLAQENTAGAYSDSASGDERPVIRHIHNLLINAANTHTQAINAALRAEAAVFSPRPRTLSTEAAEVTQAFRAMSIHTPAPRSPASTTNIADNTATEGHYEVSVPEQNVVGYEDRSSMASGAVAPHQEEVGLEEPTAHCHQSHSVSSSHADLSPCPQCREPREYCHEHNPPVPIPKPIVPLPIAEPVRPVHMATLSLNREEAEALAGRLATALGQGGQDPAAVPPPYPVEEHVAQGVGVCGRGRCGCSQARNDRPVALQQRRPSPHPCTALMPPHTTVRSLSPPLQGYEYNRGAAYVPFNILNEQGVETPVRYIKVHLDVPNPFAEARMSMQGPVYCGEIHAAPVNDTKTPAQELTTERIRIIGDDYRYQVVVNEAVDRIRDRSLKAEVRRYRGLKVKSTGLQEQIRCIEDQLFVVQMDQRANWDQLQDVQVWERVNKEVRRDQRIHPLTPCLVARGRLP